MALRQKRIIFVICPEPTDHGARSFRCSRGSVFTLRPVLPFFSPPLFPLFFPPFLFSFFLFPFPFFLFFFSFFLFIFFALIDQPAVPEILALFRDSVGSAERTRILDGSREPELINCHRA